MKLSNILLNKKLQDAAKLATPEISNNSTSLPTPIHIKCLIAQRRKVRRKWQNTRTSSAKQEVNAINIKTTKERKVYITFFKIYSANS